jgi:hypothetical protein
MKSHVFKLKIFGLHQNPASTVPQPSPAHDGAAVRITMPEGNQLHLGWICRLL